MLWYDCGVPAGSGGGSGPGSGGLFGTKTSALMLISGITCWPPAGTGGGPAAALSSIGWIPTPGGFGVPGGSGSGGFVPG